MIYPPKKISFLLSESWNTESADIHAIQGDRSGVQSGGTGAGDHHSGDDRRRRWVFAQNKCKCQCRFQIEMQLQMPGIPRTHIINDACHRVLAPANCGCQAFRRWPQVNKFLANPKYFSHMHEYLETEKFQILRLIDMPGKWPSPNIYTRSDTRCRWCRCSSVKNKIRLCVQF